MIVKYGVGYKSPSYHDIREKLLKQEVDKIDVSFKSTRMSARE